MKKTKIYALCVALALLCCSCGLFGEQQYICDVSKVETIQIVKLDKYIEEEYRFDYTVISQVADNMTFVEQLNKMEHSVNWGDPRHLKEQDVVVRIAYNNGDFDLLHSDAQYFNRSGANQYGFFFFNDEAFDELISVHMQNK